MNLQELIEVIFAELRELPQEVDEYTKISYAINKAHEITKRDIKYEIEKEAMKESYSWYL